jgi:hypothetical protein
VVSKSPEILSKCLNDTFLENKIKNKLTVDQRLTKSNSGEITWDQLDSGKSIIHRIVISADSRTKCNKDEPGNGWLRMRWHHGRFNRQVEVAQCTSTSAEKNDTKFTAS